MLNWLASYPKSGNTWVRVFLTAYIIDCEPDINELVGTVSDQLPQAHRIGYEIDIHDVDPEHDILTRSMALLRIAYTYKKEKKIIIEDKEFPLILKTHAANVVIHGMRLIPPTLTDKIVVIIRDPRDVAISFSKHFGYDLEKTVDLMISDQTTLEDSSNREKSAHHATSWLNNVALYATATDLNITIVKYEQLKEDPIKYFTWILKWFNIPVDDDRVARAVKNCELSKLKKQEKEHGFSESSEKTEKFFGDGATGGWKGKLTDQQIRKLEHHAETMMVHFGYLQEKKMKLISQ